MIPNLKKYETKTTLYYKNIFVWQKNICFLTFKKFKRQVFKHKFFYYYYSLAYAFCLYCCRACSQLRVYCVSLCVLLYCCWACSHLKVNCVIFVVGVVVVKLAHTSTSIMTCVCMCVALLLLILLTPQCNLWFRFTLFGCVNLASHYREV